LSFTRALVRPPGTNYADGLTRAGLGSPSFTRAKAQHEQYCAELERFGLKLTHLSADARYPDGTFVEDAAVVTGRGAIIARPGADVRRGEVPSVREALSELVPMLGEIEAPGTLDGGDVCETRGRFLIGLSERTNDAGAGQLRDILKTHGYDATIIDIRSEPELLHLKTGLFAMDDGRLAAVGALAGRDELRDFEIVRVADAESYAANAVCINGRVLLAKGYPLLEAALTKLRYEVVAIEMSEFRKMDGGLSCLSIRL
jgi:dimethylargininase